MQVVGMWPIPGMRYVAGNMLPVGGLAGQAGGNQDIENPVERDPIDPTSAAELPLEIGMAQGAFGPQ